ncbi:MAG: NTP transferase domain-containing protein [Proteobacteria bacterium]|nr:NTP transferase domain-containing protein [Pseudomonadota bacterium]MCH8081037.1 NTP transferase domain-containing protein [Pseudomonadota bacterium]MCH8322360.1 NTP transferase domain-containing protein [Pseudomonadota bacterium]
MQCLIVAAGKGLRLRRHGNSKPLVELAGKPLIQYVIENAAKAGVAEFVVVTGYEASVLDAYLKNLAPRIGVSIRTVYNPDYEKPNGLSVFAARQEMGQRFLLSMCDHLMAPEMVREMAAREIADDQVMLAIDTRLDNPYVDLEDVTRVLSEDGRIKAIGKGMENYNAYDTGLFLASHALFEALAESGREGNDFSISGGMMKLAAAGRALTHTIGDHVWIDVDSPEMYHLAEKYLSKKP